MKKGRRVFAVLLTMVCLMATSMSVCAAEPEAKSEEVVTTSAVAPRSIYGYAAKYTDYFVDTFTVNAPGSSTATGHATIKSSDFSSSSVIIYVNIYRPDGSRAVTNAKLTGNQEKVVSFTNAQPGTYTVSYSVTGTVKGWMHCWIY